MKRYSSSFCICPYEKFSEKLPQSSPWKEGSRRNLFAWIFSASGFYLVRICTMASHLSLTNTRNEIKTKCRSNHWRTKNTSNIAKHNIVICYRYLTRELNRWTVKYQMSFLWTVFKVDFTFDGVRLFLFQNLFIFRFNLLLLVIPYFLRFLKWNWSFGAFVLFLFPPLISYLSTQWPWLQVRPQAVDWLPCVYLSLEEEIGSTVVRVEGHLVCSTLVMVHFVWDRIMVP